MIQSHPDISLEQLRQQERHLRLAADRARSLRDDAGRGSRFARFRLLADRRLRAAGDGRPRPGVPPPAYRRPAYQDDVTIRRARPADTKAVVRLAILSDARPIEGEILVVEVAGELWAACSLDDGRVIDDPFRPTLGVRSLLDLRREHLAAGGVKPAADEPELGDGVPRWHLGTR